MTTRQVDPVAPEILPGRLPAQAELKQPGVAAIVDLCAELPCPTPRLRAAVVAMLDPDLPFGAGAGAALAWPRLCFAAEGAHTAGRPVSSAPHEFFANDLPQVGFEVTAFDDAAKGIVDDRLLATLTSQRLEMFDDWRALKCSTIGASSMMLIRNLPTRWRTAACHSARLTSLPAGLGSGLPFCLARRLPA